MRGFSTQDYPARIGYARYSTGNQGGSQSQEQLLKRLNPTMTEIIVETNSRLRMEETILWERLANDQIPAGTAIIATETDRFGGGDEGLALVRLARKKGVHLLVHNGPQAELTEEGMVAQITNTIEMARAEEEVNTRRSRAARGMERYLENGGVLGRPAATSELQDRVIMDLRELGYSYNDIAEAINVSRSTIRRRVKSLRGL